jgi:hypothetical protein
MLKSKDFWVGIAVGVLLYIAYQKYGKKATGGMG